MSANQNNPLFAYVMHHLENWQVGQGFWCLHLDSLFISIALGALVLGLLYRVSRAPTYSAPSRLEAGVEWIVEITRDLVRSIYPKGHTLLESTASFVFIWLVAMNAMDFLPVDFLPNLAHCFGISYFRPVPTSDCNITFGLGLSAISLMLYLLFKGDGFFGGLWHLLSHPLGGLAFPLNLFLNVQSFASKAFTFGLRIFLNMLIGGLLFIGIGAVGQLVLLRPWYWQLGWLLVQPFIYAVAAALHVLATVLQAYMFTLLLTVYTRVEVGEAVGH